MKTEGSGHEVTIRLTAEERLVLDRDINGRGGFQSLLRAIRARIREDSVSLTPALRERILRYASRYGRGGFQGRLGRIVDAARRS